MTAAFNLPLAETAASATQMRKAYIALQGDELDNGSGAP